MLLSWEPRIDTADLAARSGLSPQRVRGALTRLGTAGRVGYDAADAAYFHRELPYDAGRAEARNPRLTAARALLADDAVHLHTPTAATAGPRTATVRSGERHYQVREAAGGVLSCTCQWWADYRGRRGPCKHALAVRMAHRGQTATKPTTTTATAPTTTAATAPAATTPVTAAGETR